MEQWKDVPGYEGLYQISIDTKEGRCRSLKNNMILNNKPNRLNRIFWGLYKNGKRTYYQAARWIALTYPELIENEYFEGAQIDHIDTDRMNNQPSNLRWTTRSENMFNPLTRKHNSKAHMRHLARINNPNLSKPVKQFSKDGILIREYPSIREAQRATGIDCKNISHCCLGKKHYNTAGGFIWKYE